MKPPLLEAKWYKQEFSSYVILLATKTSPYFSINTPNTSDLNTCEINVSHTDR